MDYSKVLITTLATIYGCLMPDGFRKYVHGISLAFLTCITAASVNASTFTLTANLRFDDVAPNAIDGLGDAMNTLLPDGSLLHYVFDFDQTVPDVNPDPEVGEYPGAVTGLSLRLGSYDFAQISNPCLNADIDCRVRVFSEPNFATYALSSDVRSANEMGEDLIDALELSLGQFQIASVSATISLGAGQVGPFTTGDALIPPNLFDLSGQLNLFPGPSSLLATDGRATRIFYELENVNIVEGVAPVPLPAAIWLFGSGLMLVWRNKAR